VRLCVTDDSNANERDAEADAAADDDGGGGGGEAEVPLSGINDDGYFGDASGQWMSLEPNTEITFATVGRCRMTVSKPVLKAPGNSA
jgi:hypothetical protein